MDNAASKDESKEENILLYALKGIEKLDEESKEIMRSALTKSENRNGTEREYSHGY